MKQSSQEFFDIYMKAYDQFSAEDVAELYYVPSIIMSEDQKNVMITKEQVIESIQSLMDNLKKIGVVSHKFEILQSMRLSESILFTNVKWLLLNDNNEQLFTCHVSYTLQRSKSGELLVVASVLDDEESQILKLMESKGS